ncbi:MAG: DUF1643 domain-containing protein [Pseudosphingobacterium sp.]|nr:DUF1643 domain-containing protein [Pseudosphingobacterium sp.]
MEKGAIISDCGKYRFKLWRIWNNTKPLCLFIMHNPSKADANIDDPTIRRCMSFAHSWGYGGIYVGNLYPFRATDPNELRLVSSADRKNNPENYYHVKEMYDKCSIAILAYGNPTILDDPKPHPWLWNGDFYYLKLTNKGFPCHPLYLKKDLKPIKYEKP